MSTLRPVGGVAILFWFYRDLRVCRNRLDVLRHHNPDCQIFGLYGGEPEHAALYRDALSSQLDDFWAFEGSSDSDWKWRHGDLLLAEWYESRGRTLEWDHVFVAQWDMLVLDAVDDLVPALAPDEVLLCGVRPVADVERTWVWVRRGHAPAYQAFTSAMAARFGSVEPLSCVFVVACIPRALLEAYKQLPEPDTGYVEYRLPTLASAVGLRVVESPRLAAWRPADEAAGRPTARERVLNGVRRPVVLPAIVGQLLRSEGARVFHPYHGLFPLSPRWAAQAPVWAVSSARRAAARSVRARLRRRRG
jgi:hypothetical protein